MNAGPDVEQLLSDWLDEEAPARAPGSHPADSRRSTRPHETVALRRHLEVHPNERKRNPRRRGRRHRRAAARRRLLPLRRRRSTTTFRCPCATSTPTLAPSASAAVVPAAQPDGRPTWHEGHEYMLEHFGNAFDGSEAANEPNAEIRRFYSSTQRQRPAGFMPGQPAGGKDHASLSPDGTKRWPSQVTATPTRSGLPPSMGTLPYSCPPPASATMTFPHSRRTGCGSSSRTTTVKRRASPSVTSQRARSRPARLDRRVQDPATDAVRVVAQSNPDGHPTVRQSCTDWST